MRMSGRYNWIKKIKFRHLFSLVAISLIFLSTCSFVDLEGLTGFEKEIISFSFNAARNSGKLNNDVRGTVTSDSVSITVPYNTDLQLVPTIVFNGKSLNPKSELEQIFTDGTGMVYTVTAEDNSRKNYMVTVHEAKSDDKDITAFIFFRADNASFLSTDFTGDIDGERIRFIVPAGTDTGSLTPDISITGVSVTPASLVTQSFPDGSGIDYTVTAWDDSTKVYTVTVYQPPLKGNLGVLSFTGISPDTVTVNWTKATDACTPQAALEYRIYYSTTNNITTVADMESNGTAAGAYTADINAMAVGSLNPNTHYYFNVIARDEHDNKTAYAVNSVSTPDNIPPVPGNSGLITFSNATAHTLKASWTKATDNSTPQAALEYRIYYSTANNITTVADMEAHGTPFGAYSADINSQTVTGLNDSTVYYFNVIVRDSNNNKSAYTSSGYTMPDAIPPALVTITGVTEGDGQVSIQWDDPGDADFDHVEISWIPDGTTTYSVTKGVGTFTAAGLVNNTCYTFSLISVDTAQNKSVSLPVKASPTTIGPFINYCIYTADDLNAIRGGIKTGWDKTKSYIQMADIDLSAYSPWTPLGVSNTDSFSGNFNGNGHTITGLYINTTANYQGLFGYVLGSTKLRNIKITGCNITGGQYTGGLFGCFLQDGTGNALINDCFISGSITGTYYTGGLGGWVCPNTAVLSKSYVLRCGTNVTISVPSTTSSYSNKGGLVARLESSWTIRYCYSTGEFVNTNKVTYIGGLIGSSNGLVEYSYSRINVTGNSMVGGFLGGSTGFANYCYSTGDVVQGSTGATNFGGFVGSTNGNNFSFCYYCGTLTGSISDNPYGIRKTGVEMKQQATYENWNFTDIWSIDGMTNNGYPFIILNRP